MKEKIEKGIKNMLPWVDQKYLALSFDLYTRVFYVASFIELIRKKGRGRLKVLDVGGRDGKLNQFLHPVVELTILDVIKEAGPEDKNYTAGSILEAPFPDESFDIVVSSDVFEHIAKKDRKKALEEMFRLSKNFVILAAPFYSKEVLQAEREANRFYKEINGEENPWLKEHFEAGLPRREDLEKFLKGNNFDFCRVESNNINVWLLLQLLNCCFKLGPDLGSVHGFYNQNISRLGDSSPPIYRTIYLISKKGKINNDLKFEIESKFDPLTFNKLIVLVMREMAFASERLVENKNKEIENKNKEIENKNKEIENLRREIISVYNSRSWKLLTFLRRVKGGIPVVRNL